MIKYIIILSTLLFTFVAHDQLNSNNRSVSQNTTFESGLSVEGRFDVTTTTIGSQPCPIMTTTQRDAIGSPTTGDCVFNSTDAQYEFYSGSQWDALGGGTSATIDNILIKYNLSTGETVDSNIYSVGSLVGINQASSFGDLAVYDSGTDSVITLNNSVSGSTSSDGLVISQESNAASIQNKEADSLILGTNASDVLEIESDGTISAVSATYESLVTADDDIPNKKYVDDGITTSAATKQDLDGDLTAISALSSSGILARTGSETYSARTIQGTTDEITVTNGNGVGGDPTIGISNNPVLGGNEGVTIPNGTTAQRPGSPNTGELRWNTTDTAAEIYDGTDWSAVGGGLGSAQTISIVQADDDGTDISGNNATFDGGGTINGSITENTTASNFLTGEKKVYFYDASATPQNDYFGWTRNIPQGWRGRTIAYEFTYRTDAVYQNGDIVWQIKDNTNGDLLITNGLPLNQASNANGNGETIRGLVNIPEDAASLDFGFQVAGTTASFDFFVDKISLDIDDFNYKDFESYQTAQISQGNGHGSTNTKIRRFTNTDDSTGSGLFTFADSATLGSSITFHKKAYVTITYSDTYSSGVTTFGLSRNSNQLTTNIGVITQANRLASTTTDQNNNPDTTAWTGYVNAGDVIRAHTDGFVNGTTNVHLGIKAVATSKHVVVDSGDADIETYKIPWTVNFWDTTSPTSNFDISLLPLTSSKFIEYNDTTQTRIVAKQNIRLSITFGSQLNSDSEIEVLDSTGNLIFRNTARTDQTTTTGATAIIPLDQGDYVYLSKGNSINRTASISITAEKRTKGEYHLVPVTDQENVFSARIANNGTASIVSQNGSWIESVSRTSLGKVAITVKAGIFTVVPSINCSSVWDSGTTAYSCGLADSPAPTATSFTIEVVETAAAPLADFDFTVTAVKQGADYKEPKAFIGNVPLNYFQTKILSTTLTGTGVVSDLTFNNLVVGRSYRVDVTADFNPTSTGARDIVVDVDCGTTLIGQMKSRNNNSINTGDAIGYSFTFVADATTLTFEITTLTGNARLVGDGTKGRTFATLTELNHTQETTRF